VDNQQDPTNINENEQEVNIEEVESVETGTLTSMTAVENLIKRKLAQMDELKEEASTYKEMIDGYLDNDADYSDLSDKAKEAAKAKGARKKELLQKHEIESTVEKYKENQTSLKELRQSLSADLSQFQRLSGANEIELDAGDLRQIVFVGKLVKRSQQG